MCTRERQCLCCYQLGIQRPRSLNQDFEYRAQYLFMTYNENGTSWPQRTFVPCCEPMFHNRSTYRHQLEGSVGWYVRDYDEGNWSLFPIGIFDRSGDWKSGHTATIEALVEDRRHIWVGVALDLEQAVELVEVLSGLVQPAVDYLQLVPRHLEGLPFSKEIEGFLQDVQIHSSQDNPLGRTIMLD